MDEAEIKLHQVMCPNCELTEDGSLPCRRIAIDSYNRCLKSGELPTKCLLVALFGIIEAISEQVSPEVAKRLAALSLYRFASMTATFISDDMREETKKEFHEILNGLRNSPKGGLDG